MSANELRQLAALLDAVKKINDEASKPHGLYIGEAIIYDNDDTPVARLDYTSSGEIEVICTRNPDSGTMPPTNPD